MVVDLVASMVDNWAAWMVEKMVAWKVACLVVNWVAWLVGY
jgi:hypothetical protein